MVIINLILTEGLECATDFVLSNMKFKYGVFNFAWPSNLKLYFVRLYVNILYI